MLMLLSVDSLIAIKQQKGSKQMSYLEISPRTSSCWRQIQFDFLADKNRSLAKQSKTKDYFIL